MISVNSHRFAKFDRTVFVYAFGLRVCVITKSMGLRRIILCALAYIVSSKHVTLDESALESVCSVLQFAAWNLEENCATDR